MYQRMLRGVKTIQYLGLQKTARFAVYAMAKKSGYFRYRTRHYPQYPGQFTPPSWLDSFFPSSEYLLLSIPSEQQQTILDLAEMVIAGKMLAFGRYPAPISFDNPAIDQHWSIRKDDYANGDDVKLHWEAARFSWVFPLIQAYLLTGDARYVQAFQQYFEQFNTQNPLDMGDQWSSGQEVGLRLIALICAYAAFHKSAAWDEAFKKTLIQSIWQHAWRIPPTVIYAKAQNNNHLLSEALAMFYAGAFFACLPSGKKLQDQGWQLFNRTLQAQIQPNGTYVQQSMNYHRLMLTEALWAAKLSDLLSKPFPEESIQKLHAATQWLEQFVQQENGQVPNLGHNDGSLIFPFYPMDYQDQRPVLGSCRIRFSGETLPQAPLYASWLGIEPVKNQPGVLQQVSALPMIHGKNIQVYLRAEHFPDRPAHADQLHTDIWFNGENIAMDAGTYRYTDMPPWQNGLAHTLNHNTITLNHTDQMTWAGRFLWLDWCKADYLKPENEVLRLSAVHDGYKKLGVYPTREITSDGESSIQVLDTLKPTGELDKVNQVLLHWLLPNGKWQISDQSFLLDTAKSSIRLEILRIHDRESLPVSFAVYRCGKLLHGEQGMAYPTLGWVSPTYNVKLPALSLLVYLEAPTLPLQLLSKWELKKV